MTGFKERRLPKSCCCPSGYTAGDISTLASIFSPPIKSRIRSDVLENLKISFLQKRCAHNFDLCIPKPEELRCALRKTKWSASQRLLLLWLAGRHKSCSEQSAAKKKKKKVALWLLGEMGRKSPKLTGCVGGYIFG
jgi:hypothetical protein